MWAIITIIIVVLIVNERIAFSFKEKEEEAKLSLLLIWEGGRILIEHSPTDELLFELCMCFFEMSYT